MPGRYDHVLALDRRSLALFRIALGTGLLLDLAARLPDLRAFYTDDGVLPRDAWLEISDSWWWSLHLATGSLWGQALLFAVAAAAAVGLIAGIKPRLCAAVLYIHLLSLYFRNPLVADFGDWTLQAALLWAMFLPLDSPRWPSQPFEGPKRIRSVATAAFLAQLLLLYSTSAVHKVKVTGLWAYGTVLPTVLQLRATSTPAGLWLAQQPSLCAVLSSLTLIVELLGPLLLFLPWKNGPARLVAAGAFIGLHLSFRIFLRLGLFPFMSVVPWLAVLPSELWDRKAPADGIAEDPLPRPARILATSALVMVSLWAVLSASSAARALDRFQPIAGTLGLAHVWSMFSGSKYQDGWFRAPAVLASGARIDLLTGEAPVDGPPQDPSKPYGDRRWSAYQRQLFGPVAPGLWPAWANWLCTREKGTVVEVQIERFTDGAAQPEVMISGKCRP